MPRFAANLSMLFTEAPLLERFERAERAGFAAVELQFPYDTPAEQLQQALFRNKLTLVLHNLPAGDWAAGERGIACLPDRVDEFREGVARAVEVGSALGVPQLNCLAGKAPIGAADATLRKTFVENLKFAAGELKKAKLKMLIEPINTFDIPGFYLNRTAQALAILDEVAPAPVPLMSSQLSRTVQYDIYHAQRMEGEIAATMSRHLARIGHVQIADNPGRNEPGTGELNYAFLFAHLDRIGYAGHVGCEYKPATTTEAGLGWRQRFTH